MKTVSQIIDQIKEIDCINTDTEVAKSLGMSGSSLSKYKYRGPFPYKYLQNFCAKREISFELLVGQEEEYQDGYNPEGEVIELMAQVALLEKMLEEERNRSK